MILEVNCGGDAYGFIDRGVSHEAQDGQGVVRLAGSGGEGVLGAAAEIGLGRESVVEALGEGG